MADVTVTQEDREAAELLASYICGCAYPEQRKRDVKAVLSYRTTALAAKEAELAAALAKVEKLREARNHFDKVLRGYPVPEDYANLTDFQMAYLNWRKQADATLAETQP